jgi:hypothetical protein
MGARRTNASGRSVAGSARNRNRVEMSVVQEIVHALLREAYVTRRAAFRACARAHGFETLEAYVSAAICAFLQGKDPNLLPAR